VLGLQLSTTHITSLRQCHKDGLASNDLSIHLIDSPGRILGGSEANESKAPGDSCLHITHDTCTGNGTHGRKFIPENIIGNTIVKVLDIKIHSLELGNPVHLLRLILGPQLSLPLSLLLRTSNEQNLGDGFTRLLVNGGELLLIQGIDSGNGTLVGGEVDETESEGLRLIGFRLGGCLFLGRFLLLGRFFSWFLLLLCGFLLLCSFLFFLWLFLFGLLRRFRGLSMVNFT